MRLQNIRIKSKLLMLIALTGVVTAAVSYIGSTKISQLNASITAVDDLGNAATIGARMNQNLIILNREEYRVAEDPSEGTIEQAAVVVASNRKEFDERFASALKTADETEKAQLAEIQRLYALYVDGLETTFATARKLGKQITMSPEQRQLNNLVISSRERANQLQATAKAYVDHIDARSTELADAAKADGQVASMLMTAIALAGVSIGITAGYFLSTVGISKPLNRAVTEMNLVADGDETVLISGTDRKDEVGDLARAFGRNAERVASMARRQRELETEALNERKEATLKLADEFERSVGIVVNLVSSAATEMQATASQLSASAQETSAQAVAVSAAAEEAATNVSSVASSAEELGSSVNEIGRQVTHSSRLAREAVAEAGTTADIVTELTQAAARIGDIVDLISGIAGQTNLLALNATIEAARAGEAGRGFAVVASEVKNLAGQTAKATSEISAQIGGIQATTQKAVQAIGGISGTIRRIDETASAIASAVEQQGAATREIVQSVNQASLGTGEVTSNIVVVSCAAEETGAGASQVLEASSDLAKQAETLRAEVQSFLMTVRAA